MASGPIIEVVVTIGLDSMHSAKLSFLEPGFFHAAEEPLQVQDRQSCGKECPRRSGCRSRTSLVCTRCDARNPSQKP